MLKRCTGLTAAVLLALGTAACGGGGAARADGRLAVVAAFYPFQWVTERVGGDAVGVTTLARPGTEPHDIELKLDQAAAVADARLVVYLKGFQPNVDKAVAGEAADHALDAATVSPLLP